MLLSGNVTATAEAGETRIARGSAFGHGSQARHLHAALDQFPINADVRSMIYVVWYFVSGCMLVFGVTPRDAIPLDRWARAAERRPPSAKAGRDRICRRVIDVMALRITEPVG